MCELFLFLYDLIKNDLFIMKKRQTTLMYFYWHIKWDLIEMKKVRCEF